MWLADNSHETASDSFIPMLFTKKHLDIVNASIRP